jgi:hypothetical protein
MPRHYTLAALCHNFAVQDIVVMECNATGKQSGFKSQELLQAVPDEWTPENRLVTLLLKKFNDRRLLKKKGGL